MSGGSNTTTSQSSPYGQTGNLLNQAQRKAGRLFGGQSYSGPSKATRKAERRMMRTARQAGNTGYNSELKGIIGQGGLSDEQVQARDYYQGQMGQEFNPQSMPGFSDVLAQSQNAARDAVMANQASRGRVGSPVHQESLAGAIGDTTANLYMNEYQNWLGRQQGAARDLANLGQTAQGNLQTAYQGLQMPAAMMSQVGQARDTRRMQRQAFPWQQIGNLGNAAGLASPYATQTQTIPGQSPLQTLAGFGLGVSGLF